MDYISIIFAGIGGGLGGLIGYLISKKVSGKNMKTIVMIVPMILLSRVSSEIAKSQQFKDKVSPPSRLELFARESTDTLKNNKNFTKAITGLSQKEVSAFIQQKTQQGLKRLPSSELLMWNDLRIKMAAENKNICAGFWTGKLNSQELKNTLEKKLSDEELKSWFSVSMQAATLELNQNSYVAPPETALQQGIQLIASTMKEDEVSRFSNALQAGTNLEDEEACWTMMQLLEGAKNFNKEDQENFLRSLASL